MSPDVYLWIGLLFCVGTPIAVKAMMLLDEWIGRRKDKS